jgi:hypothetical protein
MFPSLAAWPRGVFAASAQAHYLLAGTVNRRQPGRAGVGWVAFVEARSRAAIRGIESGPRRIGPPGKRGYLREGEKFGHRPPSHEPRREHPQPAQGDKAYHYVDPELWDGHLSWLAEAGINVSEVMASGQLEVRPWRDSTLRGGRFELNTWLVSFEQVLQSGPAAGYGQTRFMGHMEWALSDLPGVGDLIEYETRVNYVIPKYEGSVICTYDLTKFGASVVMDALRTHPAVIIGGLLQENPFFVPPDQLLQEIRQRRPASESTSTAG